MPDQESHLLGGDVLGRNYQVPLILSVCRVENDDEFAPAWPIDI